MNDLLTLADITCTTHIGVTEAERKRAQELSVTVEIPVDAGPVARADDPAAGLDYDRVRKTVLAVATARTERKTIERFAEDLASALMSELSLSSVAVTVAKKPYADVAAVRLRIERREV